MLTEPHAADIVTARKDAHLDLVLAGTGRSRATTGFDDIHFVHCALPELHLDQIDLTLTWLGKTMGAPFLIGSMTGGPSRADAINQHLAEAAEQLGLAMGVGSQRVALSGGGSAGLGRALRQAAPSIPLLSNLGAAQLVEAGGIDLAQRAVEALAADALIIHLNPLQEALQPEGDRDWRGVRVAIETAVRQLPVPVIVKEIGAGLSVDVARTLAECGVSALEVAGAGGTSWARIEAARAKTETQRRVAAAFSDWGIPTAQAISAIHDALPGMTIIGSGGIRDGVDAARSIRLGATLVAQAGSILDAALVSTEAVIEAFQVQIEQLRVVCFCTGSADLAALRKAKLLP